MARKKNAFPPQHAPAPKRTRLEVIKDWAAIVGGAAGAIGLIVSYVSLRQSSAVTAFTMRPAQLTAMIQNIGLFSYPQLSNMYIVPVTFINNGAESGVVKRVVLMASDGKQTQRLRAIGVVKPDQIRHFANPKADVFSQYAFSPVTVPGGQSVSETIAFQTLNFGSLPMPWRSQEVDFRLIFTTVSGDEEQTTVRTLFPQHLRKNGFQIVATTDQMLFDLLVGVPVGNPKPNVTPEPRPTL
jgi:hypothetical protein